MGTDGFFLRYSCPVQSYSLVSTRCWSLKTWGSFYFLVFSWRVCYFIRHRDNFTSVTFMDNIMDDRTHNTCIRNPKK